MISVGDEVVYANARAADLFGAATPAELQDHAVFDLVAPEAREAMQRRLEAIEADRSTELYEHRITRLDGNERIVQSRSVPVQHKGERAALAVIRDVTDWHEAQDRLERRAELERLIVEISAGFLDTPIDRIDRGIEEASGTVGSFVGADRSYVFLYDGDLEEDALDAVTESNTHEWCAEGIAPQKEHLQDIPCSEIPWWTEQMRKKTPLVLSSVADLPEAAAAEKEILEAQDIKSLIVLPMTRGERLVGFVRFNAVRMHVEWEEETIAALRVLSDTISSALRRKEMGERLRATKTFHRQILDQLPIELAIFDMEGRFKYVNSQGISDPERREWVLGQTNEEYCRRCGLDAALGRRRDEAIRMAAQEEKTTRIEEVIETDDEPLHYVRFHHPVTGPEGDMQIVVQNLVSNAIKYTEERGRVQVRTYQESQEVVLEVEDTGIGMEPAVAENLFKPFRQESEGMGRAYKGSGVGLAVTRRAAQQMDGTIEVETKKGKGRRFTLRLPRAGGET